MNFEFFGGVKWAQVTALVLIGVVVGVIFSSVVAQCG